MPPIAEFQNLSFSYGSSRILTRLNFSVSRGETHCVVGESGCGKTTILGLINGLLKPEAGKILIDGQPLKDSAGAPWRRSLGYCIQGNLLFPHLNLRENITIVAQKENWKSQDIEKRLYALCELLQISTQKSFLSQKPRQISGGQAQRVAIARALFLSPKILLMDEPFGALDPITRNDLQDEFLKLRTELGLTILLVTHDLPEAFKMGDRVLLLKDGQVEQLATPKDFIRSPQSDYVKRFTESQLKTLTSLKDLLT